MIATRPSGSGERRRRAANWSRSSSSRQPSRSSRGEGSGICWNACRPRRSRSGLCCSRSPPASGSGTSACSPASPSWPSASSPTDSTVVASRRVAVGRRGAVLAVSLFAASDVESWGPLDGSGVNWDAIPFLALTAATALVALLVARLRASRAVRSPEAIVVVAVAVALIGATTAALAAAAASSDEWTAARQVGLSLTGRETCGIADGVQIPDCGLARAARAVAGPSRPARPSGRSHPREDLGGTAWRTNAPASSSEATGTTSDWWSAGVGNGEQVRVIASGAADLSRAQVGADRRELVVRDGDEFPGRPSDADVVRISVRPELDAAGEVSQPYSYETRALSGRSAAVTSRHCRRPTSSRPPVRDVASARARRRRAAEADDRRRPPPLTIRRARFAGSPTCSRSGRRQWSRSRTAASVPVGEGDCLLGGPRPTGRDRSGHETAG